MSEPPSPPSPPTAPPRLEKPVPHAFTRDPAALAAWYRETLGFEELYEAFWEQDGRAQGFVGLGRDGVELQVTTCGCPDRRHEGLGYFLVYCQGVDALHAELTARGVHVWCPLKQEDWGGRSFSIEDPDGNRVVFLQLP